MGGDGSFKNVIKRREHKERSQPAKRRRLGLLEKHKDYVLRAKDFHRKERTIKILQRKAEERNPDEFYFGMVNKKTTKGVHKEAGKKPFTEDELALMKSQDLRYVSMKLQVEKRAIERLQATLQGISQPKQTQIGAHKKVFVDSIEEMNAYNPDGGAQLASPPYKVDQPADRSAYAAPKGTPTATAAAAGQKYKSLRARLEENDDSEDGGEGQWLSVVGQKGLGAEGDGGSGNGSDSEDDLEDEKGGGGSGEDDVHDDDNEQEKARAKLQAKAYRHLEARKMRLLALQKIHRELELQKILSNKKAKVVQQPGDKNGGQQYQWKQRRKT